MDSPLRPATLADLAILVEHRRRMFEEIEALRERPHTPAEWQAADDLYTHFVRLHLPQGSLRAWLIEMDGQAVASGAISVIDWPPSPVILAEQAAHLHSMYTVPAQRRRGHARRIVQAAIDYCRTNGVRRLTLAASSAGRPLYESMGFQVSHSWMRLPIE